MNKPDLAFNLPVRSGTALPGRGETALEPGGLLTGTGESAAPYGQWLQFILSSRDAAGRNREGRDHPEWVSEEEHSPTAMFLPVDTNVGAAGFPIHLEAPPIEISRLYAAIESRIWACQQGHRQSSSQEAFGGFVLGITSAVPGEGKTSVALHLALHSARSTFNPVCLIDLSLGEDTLSRRLGLPAAQQGLNSILEDRDPALSAVQLNGSDGPVIMVAGQPAANPARVARSPRIGEMLGAARKMFDLILVELPAVFTDNAVPLAAQMDGLVMVARAGTTPSHVVNRALDQIGRARLMGVVLNGAKSSTPRWLQRRLLGC